MKLLKIIFVPLLLTIGCIILATSLSTKKNDIHNASATPPDIIPSPNLLSLPKTCKIEHISSSPYILCIHNFLSDEETEHLKNAGQPLLTKSTVVGAENNAVINPERTSSSAFLHNDTSEITARIKNRAALFVHADPNHVEGLQVVHYKDGQKYSPHYDFFDRNADSGKCAIKLLGQRMATFFVYLNDVPSGVGGETYFPKVLNGLKITPKKNMAVFWFNVLPNGTEDEQTLHGGLPIEKGEKLAVNIWIRNPKLL